VIDIFSLLIFIFRVWLFDWLSFSFFHSIVPLLIVNLPTLLEFFLLLGSYTIMCEATSVILKCFAFNTMSALRLFINMLILRFNLFIFIVLSCFLVNYLLRYVLLHRFLIVNIIASIVLPIIAIGPVFAFPSKMLCFLLRFLSLGLTHRFTGCGLFHLLNLTRPLFYFFIFHGSRLLLLKALLCPGPLWLLLLLLSCLLVSRAHITSPSTSKAPSGRERLLILSTEILHFLSLIRIFFLAKNVLRFLLSHLLTGLILVKVMFRMMIPVLTCIIPIIRAFFFA
jgi:hypothetical protein